MKIFLTIFLFFLLCIFSCRQNTDVSTNEHETCLCDSIIDNTHSDTVKEYLCYKGKRVYKLQQWKDRQSLSRHSLNDNRWLYENLESTSDNKILPEQYQYFLTTNTQKDSVELIFIFNTLDSMYVIIEHDNDTIISNSFVTNKAIFHKNIFTDTLNFITVYGYTHDSLPHPETGVLSLATTKHSIAYRANYLINNSLDKVLLKFRQCLDERKPK